MSNLKDFKTPEKLEVDRETLSNTYGKFYAEPYERGFGTTIGNSLRRILLSAIPGAAVTSIKIEGVTHEFSTILGVKEDVAEIILNIKNIRVRSYSDKPKMIRINKKGSGRVYGKDIVTDADVEIVTQDLLIATLDKDGALDMEMVVETGRGYVAADRREGDKLIGQIPIDAIFSPIRKVNISVENARVGRVTDYDKLTIEIWTDGSAKPNDVLVMAAKVLKNHVDLFIGNHGDMFQSESKRTESLMDNNNLFRGVHELELSVRAVNCLKNAEIKTIAELVKKTEDDLMTTKNFGRKSLDEIIEALHGMGLSLKS